MNFDSTYEELKPNKKYIPYGSSVRILTLPMRNWNKLCNGILAIQISAFWLYLWGIETPLPIIVHKKTRLFWLYLWGIETFNPPFGSLAAFYNFDSTYEELKLDNKVYSFKWTPLFWLYLWGIETDSSPYHLYFLFPILTLPMRNWNQVDVMRAIVRPLILTLPMRNWNKAPIKVSALFIFYFDSTYEELKLFHS